MMAWWKRSRGGDDVAAGVDLGRGDRVLATAVDVGSGIRVVATAHELVALTPDGVEMVRRPWAEVDRGSWEPTTGTISVTWTDSARAAQWTLGQDQARFPEVFRDRVEASRVIDAPIVVGERTVGRAAIRKDLRTGDLVPQLMFDRSVRRSDTSVRDHGQRILDDLREQVGL